MSEELRQAKQQEFADAINELRALTQRPAAPTPEELERAAKVCDGFAAPDMAAALRGKRPAAQEVGVRFIAGLGRVMTDDEVVTLQFDTEEAAEVFASRISPSVDVDAMPELRLATQQATPEPVGEPYAYAVYFPDQPTEVLVHDLDELTDDLTNRQHAITKLHTRPAAAPAVPKVDDLAQFIRQIDGKHSMGAGELADHICEWLAAAQAKGVQA